MLFVNLVASKYLSNKRQDLTSGDDDGMAKHFLCSFSAIFIFVRMPCRSGEEESRFGGCRQ